MVRLKEGDLNPITNTAYTTEEIKTNNDFVDMVEKQVKEVTAGLISKEDSDTAIAEAIKAVQTELKAEYQKLYDAAMKQGTDLAHLKSTARVNTSEPKTFGEAIKEAFEANKGIESVKAEKGLRKGQEINMEIAKSAATITQATSIMSGSTFQSLTQYTGIISPIQYRMENYLNAVTVGSIGNRNAMWIEETDAEGTPVAIAENTTKTQLDVQYVEKTQKVEKIAVYAKVTTEMMDDLPQLISYIQSNLMKRVSIAAELALYSGNGSTPNIKGATQWATSFAAGSLASSIASANEIDVMNAIATQAKLAYGMPNAIFVHPDTMAVLRGIKGTTGHPLWNDYRDWSLQGAGAPGSTGLTIGGMKVYENPMVTSGEFLGGDLKALNVLMREGINIRLVPSGDDPINNLMTLIVEMRLVQFASANQTATIIKGDFTTAKDALAAVA